MYEVYRAPPGSLWTLFLLHVCMRRLVCVNVLLMAVAHVYPRGWMSCVTHFDTGMSEIHSMQAFYQNDSALCHQKEKVWDCAHSS